MAESDDKNALVYLLAGFGLGALMGAAAGILLAPKEGSQLRGELSDRLRDVKGKAENWVAERKSRASSSLHAAADEVGA